MAYERRLALLDHAGGLEPAHRPFGPGAPAIVLAHGAGAFQMLVGHTAPLDLAAVSGERVSGAVVTIEGQADAAGVD
jgi:hypothetical protein